MKVIMGVIYIMFSAVLFGETLEVWHYYLKNLEKQFSIAAKSYETKSGNKIILRRIPMDVMNTRFKVLAEKGGGPDIIVGPADWIGQLSGNKTNNLLFPIDEFLTEKKKRRRCL